MTELAGRHGAVNLGQGFPDSDGPAGMLEVARVAIAEGCNQYPPGRGLSVLRAAIVRDRARIGLDYEAEGEVLVTVGASEAVSAAILGLVEPGREVVVIEPYFDLYAAAIAMAGARRRTARLVPDGDGFTLDVDSLRAAITPATRMIVVNTPHNPTGAVLDRAALLAIAEIACEHDLLVLSDEVYEHLTFDGVEHVSLGTLPGMRERTIVVSSAGKRFSVTGWKVGWACAPAPLLEGILAAKQPLTFASGGPFQLAVAHALDNEQEWTAHWCAKLSDKREFLSNALRAAGFGVRHSAGSYYLCADVAPLGEPDALDFCRAMPERIGVAAVPVRVFADDIAPWQTLVRFTCCKRDATLTEAARRLTRSA
ncbi:pyridoxal phosphate-dependent aminotransferase [Nocardia sp. CDC159]|uniref:Pyridoxal phosphate-dependent aminotransferase n=2 Tax=Nocardiaceae TaxID=85025 RepID=A0A9X2E6L6_9NOCA|nr:pyridoxal phosphate-dependent aminotransferase [Nocardia pulmonis]MCM6786995.1 pyridoxal phosphate-dependent aminotransferase [Nocardia sp. CDC159]